MHSMEAMPETLLPPKTSERSNSPARSAQSVDRQGLGWRKLKRHFTMSSDTLVAPTAHASIPSGSSDGKDGLRPPTGAASLAVPNSPGKHPRNVFNRLQALFPPTPPPTATRTSDTPPVLPKPVIPDLNLSSRDFAAAGAGLSNHVPPAPQFIKVKIITWNHGYTLPKGDLSTLLGSVPTYETTGDGSKLPIFEADDMHPYHIVVVAGQECPSHSGLPLAIGGGFKLDIKDKEKKLERMKSKQGAKGKERENDKELLIPVDSSSNPTSMPNSPLAIPHAGFSYKQGQAASSHSLQSMVSHKEGGANHSIGWSAILEDWFCNGLGALPGAKPAITVEVPSTPALGLEPGVAQTPSKTTEPVIDLTSPTPEKFSEAGATPSILGNAPWSVPPDENIAEVAQEIIAHHGPYVLLTKERLMAIALYVFVHRDVMPLISGSSKSTVTAGLIGGRLGNKGGVGISLNVAGTTLLFLNAHLAAHEDRQAERLANMAKIKAELDVDTFLQPGDPRTMREDITDRFDHAFIFGDLNFRLNVTRLHAEWLIARRDYQTALTFDQLRDAMDSGEHFSGFEEAPISFPPTFKYDVLQTLKKSKSVKAALKKRRLKGLRRRLHHEPEGSGDRLDVEDIDEESSESSEEEENDERDSQSMTSSAVRSSHSQKGAQQTEEDEDDPEFDAVLGPAAQNAISNANLYASEMHAAAHRAKEKFLALVQRPASPAPSSVDGPLTKSATTVPIKKPKSLLDSPKHNSVPLAAPVPIVKSTTSSFDLPRPSAEGLRPPQLRQTQSVRSESPAKGAGLDETVGGVYDTSSKQRVPSWCDRILFKSNVLLPPEPEPMHASSRLTSFFNLRRLRKDSLHSSASSSDSPGTIRLIGASLPSPPLDLPLSPTLPSAAEVPRPSPLNRFFRGESLPQPSGRPVPSARNSDETVQSNPTSHDVNASAKRTFSMQPDSGMPNPFGPAERRQQLSLESKASAVEIKGSSSGDSNVPGPLRWLFARASLGPRDPSPNRDTLTLPPLEMPQRGDVNCLKYDTLDDQQMRLLEARSDHRPVMGSFALYI